MKKVTEVLTLALLITMQALAQNSKPNQPTMAVNKNEDHYIFRLRDKVTRKKVKFRNRYGITLAGDFYLPKNAVSCKLSELAISSSFGAVKEQSSGLYASQMLQRICNIPGSGLPLDF